MPYGIDKDLGGDSPSNVEWMDNCVRKVSGRKDKRGKTISKQTAIAICKSTFKKSHGNSSDGEKLVNLFLDLFENG